MLGDDADPKRQRERGLGRAQSEDHLARPTGGHADLAPDVGARLLVLEVLEDVEREQHVIDPEGLAVGPLDSVADVEGVGEVIGGHAPIGGQDADHLLLRID